MATDSEQRGRATAGDLRDVAGVLFRRAWLIAGSIAVVVGLSAAVLAVLGSVYRSEAKLLVRVGRESVALDPTATTGQMVSLALNRVNEINSEIEILTSRQLASRVVADIGAGNILRPAGRWSGMAAAVADEGAAPGDQQDDSGMQRAVDAFAKRLEVRAIKDSSVLTVSYEAADPLMAQEVLQKLLANYLDAHITAHRTAGSLGFFARETTALGESLGRTELALRDLKNESGIVSVEAQRETLSQRLAELNQASSRNRTALAVSRARLAVLLKQLAAQPAMVLAQENTGMAGTAVEFMRQKLYELQTEEQALLIRYMPESAPVTSIRRQIEESKVILAREESGHKEIHLEANVVRRELELKSLAEQDNLAALEAEGAALAGNLAAASDTLRTLNEVTRRSAQLERQRDFEKAMLEGYAGKSEQARIDQELEAQRISNISVLQAATLPDKPVRPNKSLVLALALLLGLTGGLALAFTVDRLDHSFHGPQDLERAISAPVLTAVPRAGTPVVLLDALVAQGKPAAKAPALTVLALDGPPAPSAPATSAAGSRPTDGTDPGASRRHHRHHRHMRRQLDAYDELRDELMILRGGTLPATFGVLGPTGGEGASTVATNLAIKLAGSGDGPGLLVDCHLDRPAMHDMFDLPLSPGLGELISGRVADGALIRSPLPHLDVLTAGRTGRFLPMTQKLQALRLLLGEWKKRYRFVVLDLPPACGAGSAVRKASLLDGVVMVVQAERSRREIVERAWRLLTTAKIELLGLVLNQRRFPLPQWLYERL
ncbi:MAG TPA: Wzz/FepE/Etk N-terminal domain-containing protein [Planctomycetota bacterium]|nr:Wzz/FepE/Etk N-terminal domain-containing protein [Planctomycetota bacterium]